MVDDKQLSWIEFHQQTRKLQQDFKLRLSQLEHALHVARIMNVSVGIMTWVKSSEHIYVRTVFSKNRSFLTMPTFRSIAPQTPFSTATP